MMRLSTIPTFSRVEDLSLKTVCFKEDVITPFLYNHSNTLQSLSLMHVLIGHGGQWSNILTNMKDQFPHLQHLQLHFLNQDVDDGITKIGDDTRIVFSKMTDYPAVPGSENKSNDRLHYDSHRIESVQEPVQLRYKHWRRRKNVVGIEYHGQQINGVLSALADTVELFTESRTE